jgi:hypothetical protein
MDFFHRAVISVFIRPACGSKSQSSEIISQILFGVNFQKDGFPCGFLGEALTGQCPYFTVEKIAGAI